MLGALALGAGVGVAAGLALGVAAADARQPDFTIEQVMSAPFPSSLVAAPAGGRVAWVYDAGGTRNVWVAEPGPGGYASHPLTHYTGDDGFDLGEVAWDPSGQTVFYIRGGSLEGGGPVNIMSRPEGPPSQDIWAVSVAGGEPRKIGPGHSPSVSPKGDQVAWLAGGQIFVAPVAAGGAPKQLLHDRGHDTAFAWSPDGSKMAFTSNRGDHTLTGVYDFASNTIKWMHPSVDTDFDPTWSPDGKRVAFIRAPAGDDFDFTARRANFPWSIWVADASTGAGHAVWTADAGNGSVVNPLGQNGNLLWGAGDRLVFPWEKTGWEHLWSVSADNGGAATPVSPAGDYEVFNVSLSPDRKEVLYSSNQDDLDHRHIFASSVAGGATGEVTNGETVSDYPVVASDGHLFTLWGHGARSDAAGVDRWRAGQRSRQGGARGISGFEVGGPASGDLPERRRRAGAWPTVSAAEGNGLARTRDSVLPRGPDPPDAAGLASDGRLRVHVCDEPVPRERGLCGSVGVLSRRHGLWLELARGRELRSRRLQRGQRHRGRRALSRGPRRRGRQAHRHLWRQLRRPHDRARPLAALGPLGGGRRLRGRARLEGSASRPVRARADPEKAKIAWDRPRWRRSTSGVRRS